MTSSLPSMRGPDATRGFTLIEVLITVVVVAVGLLSLAWLQAIGLRTNHDAYLRSQATVLAADILDRMRANSDGVASGAYDIALEDGAPNPSKNCANPTQSCNPAEMADYDLAAWVGALGILPAGDGAISSDAGGDVTVTLQWEEIGQGGAVDQQFVVSTRI